MSPDLKTRTDYDRHVFSQLGVLMLARITFLVAAGLALVVSGDFLLDLVV